MDQSVNADSDGRKALRNRLSDLVK